MCQAEFTDSTGASIVFTVFVPNDYVELPYDDFARLEQPRIASFAVGESSRRASAGVAAARRTLLAQSAASHDKTACAW